MTVCAGCGPTNRAVLADAYGFCWCGTCHARVACDLETGMGQLERYLAVKARRIREYTDGGEQ